MKKTLKKLILLVFFIVAVGTLVFAGGSPEAASGAGAAMQHFVPDYEGIKELSFGIISTDTVANLKQMWSPFMEDMEKQLRIPIKSYFSSCE